MSACHYLSMCLKKSEVFQHYPLQQTEDKIKQIYYGFLPDFSSSRKRVELGIAENDFVLGLVSRAIRKKAGKRP